MDLLNYCRRLPSRLSENQAKHIMRQVVLAAKHCRDRGVLHRDIKPENLLVNTDDVTIKLIDFGCGDLLKESPYDTFAGTNAFIPPEWWLQKSYQGRPATVWSLGVLLYNLLCGKLPFAGEGEVVSGHLQFSRGLSCECRNLIHWCLRKDPTKRPVLEEILQHKWFSTESPPVDGAGSIYHPISGLLRRTPPMDDQVQPGWLNVTLPAWLAVGCTPSQYVYKYHGLGLLWEALFISVKRLLQKDIHLSLLFPASISTVPAISF
ncbi:hypothetical protein AALO_G00182890 [Alosa alosa]|uniref:non-specific serine/threonine protein kinase n=1 Tax=Alosa alosa TaxID=278164 RepID=A0AAV6GA33_9TELE|nr:hypothetical protein AALO_G00182890 [Alosa alosa]